VPGRHASLAGVNSQTCRQVVTSEGVGMRPWPCHDDTYKVPGTGKSNGVMEYLPRRSTVVYNNTDSKQTSACGKARTGEQQLCWVAVTTLSKKTGFIPVGRGNFNDPFCGANQVTAQQNSLLVDTCGEWHAICARFVYQICHTMAGWAPLTPQTRPPCAAVSPIYRSPMHERGGERDVLCVLSYLPVTDLLF
jgi:hypothetical protein